MSRFFLKKNVTHTQRLRITLATAADTFTKMGTESRVEKNKISLLQKLLHIAILHLLRSFAPSFHSESCPYLRGPQFNRMFFLFMGVERGYCGYTTVTRYQLACVPIGIIKCHQGSRGWPAISR